MQQVTHIDTPWSRRLQRGERPGRAELREHLLEVHRQHPGFTEACAARCRDASGRNSYEWLAEVVDPVQHRTLLDLACGSGALTALCHERFGGHVALIGVDMSVDELALARRRVPDPVVVLHRAMAQEMGFIADDSIDVVICHWALTLMDPIEPVLAELRRVLRPKGILAAIVDGELSTAPGYDELHHLIYGWVQREYPGYGEIDLGDRRVRTTAALTELVANSFPGANIGIEAAVVNQVGPPDALAREAAGFFYAAFLLSPPSRTRMLSEIGALFARHGHGGLGRFSMPINRLVVRLPQA
ncbi:MAG: class I SAM-dependent methyltransferase [Thiohalocapsa sp.]|nr:class I SAM-dependent methyltransferase [Thiohalocapsa sp.]